MTRPVRILFLFTFLWAAIANIYAQQTRPVEMASLRANQQLRWQRSSPTAQQTDGPVLYQLVFTPGTTGTIAMFDNNPRHLVNSDITDLGGVVNIGGLTISAGTGIVTFVNAQTFPVTGINGVVGVVNGGTGLNNTGTVGNYLRSDGANWTSSGIQAGDIPNGYVDLTSEQSVGGTKTFTDTLTASGSVGLGLGARPGGQFTGSTPITGSAGGAGVVGQGGNGGLAFLHPTDGGNGGQFTGGIGSNTDPKARGLDGNGITATAGGSRGIAGVFNNPAGGKILSGQNNGVEKFSVDGGGNVALSGRISLGIYVNTYIPDSVLYDAACNPNDIAISGGAWVGGNVAIRESRPLAGADSVASMNNPPANSWRVSCNNGTADVSCAQAYVVCLSHASR
jgi:hypothetical protein